MGKDKQRLQAIVVMEILSTFRDHGVGRPKPVFFLVRRPDYWIADTLSLKGQDSKSDSLNAVQNLYRVAKYPDTYALDDQRF